MFRRQGIVLLLAASVVLAAGGSAWLLRQQGRDAQSEQAPKTGAMAAADDAVPSCLRNLLSLPSALLETNLPEPFLSRPGAMEQERDVAVPGMISLRHGPVERQVFPGLTDDTRQLLTLTKEILAEGKGEVVAQGPWLQVWPGVRRCLEGHDVFRIHLGSAGGTWPDGRVTAMVQTGFDTPGSLAGGGQKLSLRADALYLAPAVEPGGISYLISTAIGLPDQSSLNYARSNAGYSRMGPVVVVRLEDSEALASAAALITKLMPAGEYPSRPVAAAIAAGDAAGGRGDWASAARHYEQALSGAGRDFTVLGPVEQYDASLRLRLGLAQTRAGSISGLDNLLEASYLAEEQGRTDLLTEVIPALESVAMSDDLPIGNPSPDSVALVQVRFLHRLVELKPGDVRLWLRLAGRALDGRQPDLAAAAMAAVEGLDPNPPRSLKDELGTLHLRLAGLMLQGQGLFRERQFGDDEVLAQLSRGRSLNPKDPYGYYVEEVIAVRGGEWAAAARGARSALERGLAYPEVEMAAAFYAARASGVPRAAQEADLGQGNRRYHVPRPVRWSPDGRYVAVVLSPEGVPPEVVVYDRSTGHAATIARGIKEYTFLDLAGWSPGSDWLYFSELEQGIWRVRPDGSGLTRLAVRGASPALSPDGERIAYASDGLWVARADGGEPALRISGGRQDTLPLWSPAGDYIVFAADTGKENTDGAPNSQVLTRVEVADPARRQVINPRESIFREISWLVPGEVLFVAVGWDDGYETNLVTLNGSWRSLADPLTAWGPVVTASAVTGEGATMKDGFLHRMDRQGSLFRQARLEGFPGYNGFGRAIQLTLTPRGDRLAYTYELPGGTGLWASGIDGSQTELVAFVEQAEPYAWSPDGAWLAVVHGGRRLAIYSAGR